MSFKEEARLHQLAYFSKDENQSAILIREGRAQDHWLNHKSAKEGRIFYDDYNVFQEAQKKRGNNNNIPVWFYDTLRSQHIPYNFFIPFKTEKQLAIKVLSKLLSIEINEVADPILEFPPQKLNPLTDKTSFDAFIEFTAQGKNGFIGIEVKYSEGGYSPSSKEKERISEEDSAYINETLPEFYKDCNEKLLKKNTYRQIWRNHILASAFAKDRYQQFVSITLYPEGNKHFESALKVYDSFLTEVGKKTLIGITYEEFIQALIDFMNTDKQRLWIKYLIERYIVKDKEHLLNQIKVGLG